MKLFLALLLALTPTTGFAQSGTNAKFTSVTGADYNTNMVLNPSAYDNALNISGTCTVGQDLTAAYQIASKASFSYSCTAGQYIEWTLRAPSSEQATGNCEFKGKFTASAAGMEAQILDGSANVLSKATLTLESAYRDFTFNNPCGASGARKVRLSNPTGGTITGNTGKLYYGSATNIAYVVPEQKFTATISETGTVSSETGGDWINGNCVASGTNNYQKVCTYITSFFSATPNCQVSSNNPYSPTAAVTTVIASKSASAITVQTFDTSGGASGAALTISCTKTGADSQQPAVTAQNWNFDWTACPSITSTHTTNATTTCKLKRQGGDAWFDISTSYSGTTDTANLQYTLPITIDTSRMTQAVAGDSALDSLVGGAIDAGVATYTLSVNYLSTTSVRIVAGNATGTYVQTNNAIASNAVPFTRGSGDSSRVVFRVPVVGWLETYNALQLVGNITNDNTEKTFRTEYASVSAAAAVTNLSNTGWVSCTGTTSITCTFAKAFAATPNCQGTPVSPLGNFVNRNSVSTTQVVFNGYVSSTGAGQATAFDLECTGPR